MARFYDPKDPKDLAMVESVLRRGGVEYTVCESVDTDATFREVHVAEEDFSLAEELLLQKQAWLQR